MGLEHIETQEVTTATSSVDFINVFDGSADRYVLYIDNYIPSSNGQSLQLRLSSDGGSTFDSGTSDYVYSRHGTLEDGSTSSVGSSGNSVIGGFDIGSGNTTNDSNSLKITISNPENSTRATTVNSIGVCRRGSATNPLRTVFTGGERLTQSSIDSIRLFMTSGDIDSGIFSLYAVTQDTGSSKDHIQTIEANSQSTVDFTNVFASDDRYDRYKIKIDNILPSNNGVYVDCRLSSDGGSTWDSGTSDYAHSDFYVHSGGSAFAGGSGGNDRIANVSAYTIGNNPDNNDTGVINGVISQPTNQNKATVTRWSSSAYNNSAAHKFARGYSGGIRLSQSAIDSIQFFARSGNIASGTFSIYGIGGN